jgi:hypothetical protein
MVANPTTRRREVNNAETFSRWKNCLASRRRPPALQCPIGPDYHCSDASSAAFSGSALDLKAATERLAMETYPSPTTSKGAIRSMSNKCDCGAIKAMTALEEILADDTLSEDFKGGYQKGLVEGLAVVQRYVCEELRVTQLRPRDLPPDIKAGKEQ